MTRVRRNIEAELLRPFQGVARSYGLVVTRGQGIANRLSWGDGRYVQFGDLRVEADGAHVVVEVESAGGLHNLVKYWYPLANGLVTGPLHLLHLYSQSSPNDFAAHVDMWHFLSSRMTAEFKGRFSARLYRYDWDHPAPVLAEAAAHFESLLRAHRVATRARA